MDLNLVSAANGEVAGTIGVDDSIFSIEYNETLVHQLVTAYQAGGRAGTKAQKTRSEVSGGGAKPWRQKGTGRARAGTSSSPIWRTGGVTFAAKPRDYAQKINKKMYRKGIKCILSQLVREERLFAVEELGVSAPKTKDFSAKLQAMNVTSALFVVDKDDENISLASRNIPNVHVINVNQIDPVSLVGSKKILMTEASIRKMEEALK
ncbi:MAG: 50S ribosomal protein L4 [Methylococcales bacterium]|nr:50S ribosomal protein L4 [Methylococcales bacterium]MBT7445608.1 50S ribosomal protein L4 [Methylococcales bacterium]